jgi:hypothetical protein
LIDGLQGYEGSLLKVTSKNGKTASPVGFVTFNSRAGAEAAKQDLQVGETTTITTTADKPVFAQLHQQNQSPYFKMFMGPRN